MVTKCKSGFAAGLAVLFCALLQTPAQATLPIDVVVLTAPDVPITAPQQWARLLGAMDLRRVKIRPATAQDVPGVKFTGSQYKVVAAMTRGGDLLVDGRSYRASQRGALAKYFRQLADTENFGLERGRFDLTRKQFAQVHGDLLKQLGISTQGQSPAEIVRLLQDKFSVPITIAATARPGLQQSRPCRAELGELSTGTALAMLLREAHLQLVPKKPAGKPLQLRIERSDPNREAWPVGWKPERSPRLLAPKMFEFSEIEVTGLPLERVLNALKPRLGVDVYFDHKILTARNIEPTTILVKHPAEKTYIKRVVDRLLSQARLAGELRTDERGRLFYWITQFGKDSPRAEATVVEKQPDTKTNSP